MQKKVAPKIKNIITPSHSSKEGIIEEFDCPKDAITVINNKISCACSSSKYICVVCF